MLDPSLSRPRPLGLPAPMLLVPLLVLFVASCGLRSAEPDDVGPPEEEEPVPEAPDPDEDEDEEDDDFEDYEDVITEDAETHQGMFDVHLVDGDLYFEIPEDKLGVDMLLLGREAAGPGLQSGFASGWIGQEHVRWERHEDEIRLRGVVFDFTADTTTAIRRAVDRMTWGPIIESFEIETFGADSAAVVDVSELYVGNVSEMSPLQATQRDRSHIDWFRAFPENVEVRAVQTGQDSGGNGTVSRLAHWSMYRLPDEPMTPRLADSRVGYLTTSTLDYSRPEHRAEERTYIRRHRLEKADPRVEVSEPVEPIVYWIDPATPEWLVPYVEDGVAQWEKAFEQAGFSNAIEARMGPTEEEDPDWSMYDARHSMIYWRPSEVANATGGSVVDPRSGEIIKGEVNMYHNVMNLLRNWYFIQAGPLDERAQELPLPDELMGELVEYVVAHEIGHAIGFPHNFKASAMYPADSIRSEEFLERKGGHVATLMDYSRFNYVAQPEDDIPPELLIPRVGPYDEFAVEWGYKPIPEAGTPDEERPYLDELARQQDTVPWFRFTTPGHTNDPHAVTEAVGNEDPVYSSTLAMRNLERVMDQLLPAAERPGEDYSTVSELYGGAVTQWGRYMGHVVALIGGAYSQEKHGTGERFEPVPGADQREAMEFLQENAFQVPEMFVDPAILRRVESDGALRRIRQQQGRVLNQLMADYRLDRLAEYAAHPGEAEPYTIAELLDDLRDGVWPQLEGERVSTDVYERTLQRAYLDAAERYVTAEGTDSGSDARRLMRADLRELEQQVRVARDRAGGRATRLHLDDVAAEIERILDPRAERVAAAGGGGGTTTIQIPLPLPFAPEAWLEEQGIEHPGGWEGFVNDFRIVEENPGEGYMEVEVPAEGW